MESQSMTTHAENMHFISAQNAIKDVTLRLCADGIHILSFRSNGAITSIEVRQDERLLSTENNGKWEWYEDQGVRVFWAKEKVCES